MNKQDKIVAGSLAVIVAGMCIGTAGLLKTHNTPAPTNNTPPPTTQYTAPTQPPVRPLQPTARDRTRFDLITRMDRDLDAFWHTELQADGKILTYVEFTFKDQNNAIPQLDPQTFGRPRNLYGPILGLGIRGTRHAFPIYGSNNHYSGTLDIRIEPGLTLDLYEDKPPLGQLLIRTFGPTVYGDYWSRP